MLKENVWKETKVVLFWYQTALCTAHLVLEAPSCDHKRYRQESNINTCSPQGY